MRDFEDKPISWMRYNGIVVGKKENIKEIYNFLKEALLLIPEQFPVRCHGKCSKTNFLYFYSPTGGIRRFFGEEQINYENEKLYSWHHVGRFISDRQYNIIFLEDRGDL